MKAKWVAGLTMALVLCPGVAAKASTTSVFYDAADDLAADPQPFLSLTPDFTFGSRTPRWASG